MHPRRWLIFFTLLFTRLEAQVPATQLYEFRVQKGETGKFVVHSPRYLSAFNEGGYNNQPFFINDYEILITVQEKGAGQTDIFKLNLGLNTLQPLTRTSLSEYSPTLTPDGKYISCVRVDDQATGLQRLYRYERKPKGKAISPLPDIKNVGYHAWLDTQNVALFLVGKPHQMALVNIESKDPLLFTSDVGRCMTRNAAGHLVYVHKISETYWYIKEYDPLMQRSIILAETLPGCEDFAMSSEGYFFMCKGSKLYVMHPEKEKSWSEVADLKFFGLDSVSRMALRGDRLILVNQRAQ